MAPVGQFLTRRGISADAITVSGLVFCAVTTYGIAVGWHWYAVILLTATGFHDLLDGAAAKASHRASQRGSFFDSVVDRLSDGLLMGGCAYELTATHHGQLVLLPMGILTASYLISYQRSKAESLGLQARGGLMERAERLILLGAGLAWSQAFIPVLWALLVLTSMTAVGRFVRVWRVADRPEPRAESHRFGPHSERPRRGLMRSGRH